MAKSESEAWVGTVSEIESAVSVHGRVRNGRGSVRSQNNIAFLLDGRPVSLAVSIREPVIIRNGDKVAVGGDVKNGIMNALAYRNLTNGAALPAPEQRVRTMFWILLIACVATIPVALGLLLVPFVLAVRATLKRIVGANRALASADV